MKKNILIYNKKKILAMKNILNYEQLFEKNKKRTPKEINKSRKKEVSYKIDKLQKELEKIQDDEDLKGEERSLKLRIKRKDIAIAKKEEQINRLKKDRIDLKDRLKKEKEKKKED